MKAIKAWGMLCMCFLLLVMTACKNGFSDGAGDEREGNLTIGVIFYGAPDINDMLSHSIFKYAEYIEENFDVTFEFVSTMSLSHMEAVEMLCESNVDAIMSANTQTLPECITLCEQNGVYWLQIMDMPIDSDIVEQFQNSAYYLGYVVNNDESAARVLAEKMIRQEIERFGVVSLPDTVSNSQTHTVRSNTIRDTLLEEDRDSLDFVLKTYQLETGLESMMIQGYRPDGLISTTKSFYCPVERLKEIFQREDLQIAYFDLVENTRQELAQGDTVAVACGQHNVVGLGFAYVYHYLNSEFTSERNLELVSDYIIVTSVEEYDQFVQLCMEQMPYSASELSEMIDSLDINIELLKQYSDRYSLADVLSRRE